MNGNLNLNSSRYIHEAAISLNVGFVVMLLIFGMFGQVDYFAPLERWLYGLDASINTFFHISNTDLTTNHFVFFIFALAIALCVWIFLRLISGTHFVSTILGPVAGVFTLIAIPLMTVKFWRYSIVRETAYPTEIVLVLYFASQYLRGKWSLRVAITLVVLHFVFWEEEIGPTFMALYRLPFKPYLFWVPSGAPIAWMVACISVLVWALYVRQFRARVSVMVPNGNAVFDHND
jgi:hypothetical protein